MAEIVAKTNIKQKKGWFYFVDRHGDISRLRVGHDRKMSKGSEKVLKCDIKKEEGYLYFVGKKGDIARVRVWDIKPVQFFQRKVRTKTPKKKVKVKKGRTICPSS